MTLAFPLRPTRLRLSAAMLPAARTLIGATLCAWLVVLSTLSTPAGAQPFPNRPVTIVVPYAPGGGTDTVARTMAQSLSALWGQRVIVENHAGADGLIGTQRVLNAPADGYTILMQLNQMLLWKWTLPTARVDLLTDFRLVSKIQHSPMAISVAAKVPGNTLKEFFAECQKSDLPCSFGSATANASLVGRQLMELGGVKNAVQVPYKGTAPMMTDLLGGHLKMGIPSASSGIPHLKNGTIKILAVGGVRRFPALPNVPTLEESGFNVLGDTWYGLMVARGTPNDVFEAIVTAVQSVSKKPELLAIIESNGGLPVFSTPAEFTEDVHRESDYLAPLGARYLKGP